MVDVRRHLPPLTLNRSSSRTSSRQRWTTSRYRCGIILLIFVSYCLGFFSGHYFAYINIDNIQSAASNNITLTTSSATYNDKNNNDIINRPPPKINNINPSAVTCDNCNGIFQYDPPNYFPNASKILSAENITYSASPNPKFKIFFPNHDRTTNPESCVKEWYENKQKYRGKGMSVWEEDLVIFDAFFKDTLMNRSSSSDMFYLEIGGHNGVRSSNTRLFDVCLGWNGLLIEPIPQLYNRMVKLRPNAHHLNMCPSCITPNIAMFHDIEYTDAVANAEGATMKIHCGPLSHPISQLDIRHINFWSLDVEGSELATLQTVDWDAVQIDIIMAEAHSRLDNWLHMAREVRRYLKGKGYILMKSVTVPKSDIFVHKNVCPKYKQCVIDAGISNTKS